MYRLIPVCKMPFSSKEAAIEAGRRMFKKFVVEKLIEEEMIWLPVHSEGVEN